MNFKNLTNVLLGGVMTALLLLNCSAEEKKLTYKTGQFTDVSASAWYEKEIGSAYELGLMNGTSDTLFTPDGNVTVAQGITMASRIHALQNNKTILQADSGAKWYENYVSYAVENGIVKENAFDDYDRPIKRSEMACLIYDGADRGSLEALNRVLYIPDVPNNAEYNDKLLALYNAGIVMGSDAKGSFYPENNLKRSECAAIINRVVLSENRLKKDLLVESARDAYIISEDEPGNYMQVGAASGWVYDNQGGIPRESVTDGNYLMITDVSDEYGTAMIREFNQITVGTVVTEAKYLVKGYGAYIEFRDIHDKPAYSIKLVDGNWSILGADGKHTPVMKDAAKQNTAAEFTFKIVLDFDKKQSTTYINDVNYGTHQLLSDNILNYRYATDEKSTAKVTSNYFCMTANYKAFESFKHFGVKEVYGWKTSGKVEAALDEMTLGEASSAAKTFDKASGDIAAQTYFILPNGGDFTYTLLDGDKEAVNIYAKASKLYFGDKELYKLTDNMWYRLRVDFNTNSGKAKIYLNGRVISEVDAAAVSGIDTFSVKTQENTAKFDNMRVFEVITYEDYVPEPSSKASMDDYLVGLNVCPIWKNGEHTGWACISPYNEPKPVLGYYDEGVPETADWEIKFMTEHGIDFQAFCWYNNEPEGVPVKEPKWASHIHEGYMYARYSDYMKYTIIWEASNGVRFGSQMFREQIVPYWFENYFMDDRYLKIDNKLVLCIFEADDLYTPKYFGSIEAAKIEFDYLQSVAKEHGFDGVIIMTNSPNPDKMAQMGIDGKYAYGWGTAGKTIQANKEGILSVADNKDVKTIPTISVGFDSIPWSGIRYGNMTVSDYKELNAWVKNDFIPTYSKDGDWNDKFVMLSTWNEYGEGTYISPAGLNGFGYLDVIRETYTNLPKEHTDHVPTQEQAQRINHLYPQYTSLLRHDGWFSQVEVDTSDNYETVLAHEYTDENTAFVSVNTSTVAYGENGLYAVSSGDDPVVLMKERTETDIDGVTHVKVTMKAPKDTLVQMFFMTKSSAAWTAEKRIDFTTDSDELKTYMISISNEYFKGTFLEMRVDPVNAPDIPFTIKSFELLKPKPDSSMSVYVNDKEFKSDIAADFTGTKYLYPFDPETGVAYALNLHHTWDKRQGILTLYGSHKTAVFTVGDDEYKIDGVRKPLGYTLYTKNSLPVMDFELISDIFGYEKIARGKNVYIKTPQYEIYERVANRVEGVWEFDDFDTEGWTSSHMSLEAEYGALNLTSLKNDEYDPVLLYELPIGLETAAYNAFEIRVKYKYHNQTASNDQISLFFATDRDPDMSESKCLKIPLPSTDSNEEWITLTYDLNTKAEWKNTVTKLRFDPFNAVGTMEIDYMKFVKDPNYVPVDDENAPFEIINGDAEDTNNPKAFYSGNSNISIVDDPVNSGNHVYLIETHEGQQWAYFRQAAKFKQDKMYKISYDVYLVGDANGNDPGSINISLNFRYPDAGAQNDYDHVIKDCTASVGNWYHVEAEYIPMKVDSPYGHEFTIYANPAGEIGVNYMVDNVVVTEMDNQ